MTILSIYPPLVYASSIYFTSVILLAYIYFLCCLCYNYEVAEALFQIQRFDVRYLSRTLNFWLTIQYAVPQ